jgi:hypothetical protein
MEQAGGGPPTPGSRARARLKKTRKKKEQREKVAAEKPRGIACIIAHCTAGILMVVSKLFSPPTPAIAVHTHMPAQMQTTRDTFVSCGCCRLEACKFQGRPVTSMEQQQLQERERELPSTRGLSGINF